MPERTGRSVGLVVGVGPGGGADWYIAELLPALLRVDPDVALRLQTRVGNRFPSAFGASGGRVTAATWRGRLRDAVRLGTLARGWAAAADRIARVVTAGGAARVAAVRLLAVPVKFVLGALGRRAFRGNPFAAVAFAAAVPTVLLAAWCGFAATRLLWALTRGLLFPLRAVDVLVRHCRPKLAQADGCDVWILPLARGDGAVRQPAVYLADGLGADAAASVAARLNARRHAAVPGAGVRPVPCVIPGSLGGRPELLYDADIPSLSFRAAPPALPTDLPAPSESEYRRTLGALANRPFVVAPTRFPSGGDDALALLAAVATLRARGVPTPDVVFFGGGRVPPEVKRFVSRHALEGRVHFRGDAGRGEESALYRLAAAAVLPSWPESGARAILAALQLGCPVLSADTPENREQYGPRSETMSWFAPGDPGSAADALAAVIADRAGLLERQRNAAAPLLARTWDDVARDWLALFREVREVDTWVADAVDWGHAKPWTEAPAVPTPRGGRLEVLLFLQVPFLGGVWQATRDLLEDLVAVNAGHGRLRLTLALPEGHDVLASIRHLRPALGLERIRMNPMTRNEAERLLGPGRLPDDGVAGYCFPNGAVGAALRADAWLALTDRFPRPLLPARPYGVVVHDMIQRHVPEGFPPLFFRWYERGMLPTLAAARCVVTTSPATRADVLAATGLDPSRVRHVPLAHNPHRRFGALTPKPVEEVRGPFLLNPTNMALHKGGKELLRAYTRLRQRLGSSTPALVLCGVDTEKYSTARSGGYLPPNCVAVRELVSRAGLVEGRDVHFLGYLGDDELLDLYQRCGAVVNAARFDNGCFNTLEAAYFGRPAVCTRYPAAEYLAERFGVPVHFYPVGDDAALADVLAAALAEPVRSDAEVARMREHLAGPEFGSRRYAERLYDVLVELAEKGRRERTAGVSLVRPAA